MEPRIVEREEFNIIGMQYIGNNQNGEIPQLWGQWFPRVPEIKNQAGKHIFYGLCECLCEGECKCGQGGDFSYIAGIEVISLDEIPEGLVGRTIPAAKYAVFTHKGSLESLQETFGYIYGTWLPTSGYTPASTFGFELYDERFDNFSEKSELDIYVPIK